MATKRRDTTTVQIISTWSNHPIIIQSMTSTPTADVEATIKQIKELEDTGSELVRITVNDFEAMAALPEIVNRLRADGYIAPIIGDFHYNGHILLHKFPEAAQTLDKYRINPGNVGKNKRNGFG